MSTSTWAKAIRGGGDGRWRDWFQVLRIVINKEGRAVDRERIHRLVESDTESGCVQWDRVTVRKAHDHHGGSRIRPTVGSVLSGVPITPFGGLMLTTLAPIAVAAAPVVK